MNTSSRRVGLILLVGVVAVAVALILRSGDKPKDTQPQHFANVLAADANGAITQTDDGTTRGYDRQGKVKWTQPPVLVEKADGQTTPKVSNFFCAGNCPDAYGNSAAERKNTMLKFGFGDSGPGTQLAKPFDATDIVIRGVINPTTLVVRRPKVGQESFEYAFVAAPQAVGGSKDLSERVTVPARGTVTPLASDDNKRVVAIEVSSTDKGKSESSKLRWFVRSGTTWKQTGKPVTAERAGACFSGDGQRVAISGETSMLLDFGGGSQIDLPVKAESVGCSFSPDGVTLSYTSPSDKTVLIVQHFDNTGKKVWDKQFKGASTFNERSGDSELFQLTTETGTLFLNAENGATVANDKGEAASFPAGGNQFVTASANGAPTWINR